MNMLKKQTVGSCFAAVTLLLGIVSFILYGANVAGQIASAVAGGIILGFFR